MEVKCLRNLELDIFKTLNHLNHKYLKESFYKTTKLTHRPLDIKVTKINMIIKTIKFRTSYLRFLAKAD